MAHSRGIESQDSTGLSPGLNCQYRADQTPNFKCGIHFGSKGALGFENSA
ncbi:hypothetical protein LEMLEM_LOCUS13746 [Lemmus lemmus]